MMLRNSLFLSLVIAVGFIFSISAEDFAVEDEITSYDAEAETTLKDDVKTIVEGEKQDASSDEESETILKDDPKTVVEAEKQDASPDEEDKNSSEESEDIVNPMAEAANVTNSSENEESHPETTDTPDENAPSASSGGTNPAANNSHFVSVSLTDTRAFQEVKLGQILEVVLDNPDNKTWNYDKITKFLKILDSLDTDGKFRITYEVINVGADRLYFDLIDNTGGKFVVLESKFLDIKSEK